MFRLWREIRVRSNSRIRFFIGLGLILFGGPINPAVAIDQGVANEPSVPKEVLPEADQIGFKQNVLAAIAGDDQIKALNELIDWGAIIDTAIEGEKGTSLEASSKEFKKGFLSAVNMDSSFAGQIIYTVKSGGRFDFLRLDVIDGAPVAVFRVKQTNQGVNYVQFFLKRSDDGLVRANDIYSFISAERMTEIARRIWLASSADSKKTVLQRFTQAPDPLVVALQRIGEMQKLLRNGQPAKVLEIYQSLPQKSQREKLCLLLRLVAAQASSEEEYTKAIEDFREYHPNDAALDFILIDGYFLKKNYEQALECIDRTNKVIGGDSCLLCMRGNALAKLRRFDEAKAVIEQALKLEPDLQDNYFTAIGVSLVIKDYEDTVKYINLAEANVNLKFGNLKEIPEYAEFVKSDEYKKWAESRN